MPLNMYILKINMGGGIMAEIEKLWYHPLKWF